MSFFIKKLAIVGVGLIGGSLAQALRSRDLVGQISGVARTTRTLEIAREMGVIDEGSLDAREMVRDATLVVVCTPVRAIVPSVREFADCLSPGAVVTDVGSVKGAVVQGCEEALPKEIHFVGGHPIAGRERAGVEASFPSLFEGSRTILTPTRRTSPQALELVRLVWEATGSLVETMDAAHHDRVLAATSHLPHLMAYNVVHTLADLEEDLRAEVFRYAAGGFRDFTRIASSDPVMWRDICLENRTAILEILGRFKENLEGIMNGVAEGNGDGLEALFARSKQTRDRVLLEHKGLRGGK
ncbi:MAG: prephenate dehydrogenase/arogenate dehydrogenase family protein [Magnetococcales bacterium]|nr:prephenate dehydrogenase/arogenate dehydrogenase family protein [Magnetococcales bacterium]